MTKITRIFLDLDGVLADWATAAILTHDHDPASILAAWPRLCVKMHDSSGFITHP
jgi:hypothetical protein